MKLYEVSGNITAYVLAENESDAKREHIHEVLTYERDSIAWRAREVTATDVLAWGPRCLVYGATKDMTLADAVRAYVEG